jgi:hypothetical protein
MGQRPSLMPCLFGGKWFSKNYFLKFFYVCLPLEKLTNRKYFSVRKI